MKSINPYTQEVQAEFEPYTMKLVDHKLQIARTAQTQWKTVPIAERAQKMRRVGQLLRDNCDNYAKIMVEEMGKTITEAKAEALKCATVCDFYADNAADFLKDEHIPTDFSQSYITYEPLGLVFAIMPWNFPFWQVFRCAVPAICAGNACILKHASNVPRCALEIEKIFFEAGLAPGLFTTLLIGAKDAMKVIDEDKIDAVSLTGSNKAGEEVGALAGRRIKPMVLELGGSDPFIVLEDADIDKAVEAARQSRLINNGQSCIAAKRLIVRKEIAEEFTHKLIHSFKQLIVGDPMDPKTDIGPVAQEHFAKDLQAQIDDAKEKGATVESATVASDTGWFIAPCVITGTTDQMRVISEEVFGPIAPVIIAESDEEIIKIANNTEYGLGSSIWSKNIDRAVGIGNKIQTGTVAINEFMKSNVSLPFGGTKKSGVGRELAYLGIREFVNIKTVVVK
jgi:succinate-semialdehyde dehydrogenase/glutarate-semialdehyde dehydrogenase